MFRAAVLVSVLAVASAFSPAGMVPQLRSSKVAVTMAHQPEQNQMSKAVTNAALAAVVATSIAGAPMLPADASINSQMSMDSNSFSVLSDNQKKYKQTSRAINPYASEEEKMKQLEKIARLEECQLKKSTATCEAEENQRQMDEDRPTKKNNPITFALPVLVTTGLSGVLLRFLNR